MERKPSSIELETEISPDSGPDQEFATCDDLSDTDSIKSSIFDEEIELTGESHLYRYSMSSPLSPVEEGEEVISPRDADTPSELAVQVEPDDQYTEALEKDAKMLDESLKENTEKIQNDPENSDSITETSSEQVGMYEGNEVILQNSDNPSLKQRKIDHYTDAPKEEEKISRREYLRRFGKKVLPPPPEDGN